MEDISELPELTPQQMEFVTQIQGGKSASDAYRIAYNTENMLERTIWANASRLKSHSKIAAWLNIVKREQLTASRYTLDDHIKELTEAQEIAKEKGQIGPMVAAIEKKGRALGLYIEKHEDINQGSDVDMIEAIGQIFGKELANEAARRLGYDVKEDIKQ
jgi:hypothetical protein